MKAHDLARQLLAGPDVEVGAAFDDVPEYSTEILKSEVETRWDPHWKGYVPIVTLWFGTGSTNFSYDPE